VHYGLKAQQQPFTVSLVQQHAFAVYGRGLIADRNIAVPFTVIPGIILHVSLINSGKIERTKLLTNYQTDEQIIVSDCRD
jgi:hypothetical protein